MDDRAAQILISRLSAPLLLLFATLGVFGQVRTFDWVNWDDQRLWIENPRHLPVTWQSGNPFDILLTSLTLANAPGVVADFNAASTYAWQIADSTSTITTYASNKFNVDTSAFQNTFTGTFSVIRGDSVGGGDDTQLYLFYTNQVEAIPEPSSIALGLCGLIGVLGTTLLARRRN